jgi:hypothetical protein
MERVFAAVDIEQTFAPAGTFKDIGSLVSVIVPNVFTLAGIIAFVLLILGGFGFIVAAGAGDSKKMEQGKKTLTGAAVGLIIILGSFWIIQIVETLTGMKGQLLPTK